jgi:hypothetical protein
MKVVTGFLRFLFAPWLQFFKAMNAHHLPFSIASIALSHCSMTNAPHFPPKARDEVCQALKPVRKDENDEKGMMTEVPSAILDLTLRVLHFHFQ